MVRAIRLGADFVFAGRPFMYGISALGEKGADHVYELFHHDLVNNMHQLGIETVEAMKSLELRRD
jgi:L-lactate dehydrogenase (cytochrome)